MKVIVKGHITYAKKAEKIQNWNQQTKEYQKNTNFFAYSEKKQYIAMLTESAEH